MKTILLLGRDGQLGWELQRSLSPLGVVVALSRHEDPAHGCGNLEDLAALSATVHRLRPAVIVNAAAYTAVDKAESEPELARTINALAPGVLAKAAHDIGALMVHFSTDYVFDGSGSVPRDESAPTEPLNVYGRTKLEGEQRVRRACKQHLIFRSGWVHAARGSNFPRTMLRLAQERDQLSVIDDQIGTPTGADLIADVTAHAIRQTLGDRAGMGTYHLAATGETSWHGYARFVLDTARAIQPDLPMRAQEIVPIASAAYPTPARRPFNSRLDTSRLRQTFGVILPNWQTGVRRTLVEILTLRASL